MNILITGGNGFIASHLVYKLGSKYKIYLHSRSANKEFIFPLFNKQTSIVGQLTLNVLNSANIDKCDCIIHLAGSFSAKTFEELVFDNLITTNSILDFMKIKRIPKIIFISSAAVWGKNLGSIANEDIPALPESEYAYTKFSAECLIKNAYLNGDIETGFILRPNTIYGYGSNSGVIDSLINQASRKLKFKIYGDGLQRRQPLNIQDLLDAIIKCLSINNRALNLYGIAGPESFSILDIARKISKVSSMNFDCEFLSAQTNKPQTILINQSKINKELSWYPRITLDNGLKSLIDSINFDKYIA